MLDIRYLYDIHPTVSSRHTYLIDIFRYLLLFCAGGFAMLFASTNGWALPTIDQLLPSNEQLEMVVNKSALVRLNQPAKRVSIVAPDIADVQIMESKQILLTAKSVGETTLIVWMEDESVRTIDVMVRVNTKPLTEALQHTLPDEAIEVMAMNQGVALRGQVQGIGNVDQAMQIANTYLPQVVNLMDVPGVHQVLLKVRIAEVARTFREETGFNFQVLENNFQGTSTLGGLVSGNLSQPDLTVSDAVTMFMGLPNSNINAFIQALKQKGLIHILAEPNLVARSGETASFLAGGEFPVPVVQGGLTNSISIEYKEFGVRLKFTPTVLDTRNMRLEIAPEVSDLDFAQGIRVSGFLVPSLITRRAQTVVNLMDGQSFAIAGLISKSKQKNHRKVPWVGDIPVFGGLFQGGDITAKETELLIMVTPHLVAPLNDGDSYPMPGDTIEGARISPPLPKIEQIEPLPNPMESPENGEIQSGTPRSDKGERPAIQSRTNKAAANSKSRRIQSSKPMAASAAWRRIPATKSNSMADLPAESQAIPSTPISQEPAMAPQTVENAQAEIDRSKVTPLNKETIESSVIPEPEAKKAASKKSTTDSPDYPVIISQAGFTKPGLMPADSHPQNRDPIAPDDLGNAKDTLDRETRLNEVNRIDPGSVILASRIEEN